MNNSIEKRDFIHRNLHKVEEPLINDIYDKVMTSIREGLINESEEDIKQGDLISHETLKEEVLNWRCTK